MKKTLFVLAIVCILFLFATVTADRTQASSPQALDRTGIPDKLTGLKPQANMDPAGLHVDFGSIPLYFTANRGQVDDRAFFYAKASRYTLWLTEAGLVFDSFKSQNPKVDANKEPFLRPEIRENLKTKRDVSRLVFLNAAKHPQIVAVDRDSPQGQLFHRQRPEEMAHGRAHIDGGPLQNIYENIDLKVYGVESRIEYDWIVRPGGDPRNIRFKYENVKGTRLDQEGNLLIESGFGELMHRKPAAYQEDGGSGNGSRTTVESAFKKIGANAYGFEVGAYEAGLELVIDPVVLAYSTIWAGVAMIMAME